MLSVTVNLDTSHRKMMRWERKKRDSSVDECKIIISFPYVMGS